MEIMSVRLQEKVKKKLKIAANNDGLTPSQYVRRLIFKALKLRLKDMNNVK